MPLPFRPTGPRQRRALARLRRFRRSEDGSMIVFGLFLLLAMLIVAGMAVDIMRFETERSRLQGTLDRAVLAAADLDQTRDCETVIRDYLRASGQLNLLRSADCTQTVNSKNALAEAEFALPTMFMDMLGVTELGAPGASNAEENVQDIEIVLVLDVSGSMGEASGGSTKIALLRTAARDFVETILRNDNDKRISIAIVPFNAQVNLGPTIFNALVGDGYSGPGDQDWNITHRHGTANSFCLDLPDPAAYAQPGIPRPLAIPQAGYFDAVSTATRNNTAYTAPQAMSTANVFCRTNTASNETANQVRLPSQDVATMRTQLGRLVDDGNTSITMGMKWANFMLDPSTRDFFRRQIAASRMPATLRDRPFDYDRPNTLKIIVVMTDGEHVSSAFLRDGYRTELSPVFRIGTSNSNYQYSVFHDRANTAYDYYVPSLNFDTNTTGTVNAPNFPRDTLDNDQDGLADDGFPGAWRLTPWDGTVDEDTDGQQTYRNAQNQLVPIPICDDDNRDNRNDATGLGPCDDDDFLLDDGRDDGDDADGDVDTDGAGQAVTRVTWNQLWAHVRVTWVAWNLFAKPLCAVANVAANNTCRSTTYDTWMGRMIGMTDVARMNATLQQSCQQAKDNRVVVYGIAFEAPPNGRDQIFRCASSPAHYIAVDESNVTIGQAFQTIAAQINALRLVH